MTFSSHSVAVNSVHVQTDRNAAQPYSSISFLSSSATQLLSFTYCITDNTHHDYHGNVHTYPNDGAIRCTCCCYYFHLCVSQCFPLCVPHVLLCPVEQEKKVLATTWSAAFVYVLFDSVHYNTILYITILFSDLGRIVTCMS